MSKRQDLIDEIVTVLKTVSGVSADKVRDFETNWQQDELPAISVFDATVDHELVNNEPEAFGQKNSCNITIQIFTASSTRAADIRSLMDKVWEKIKENKYWNDLAIWTKPVASNLQIKEDPTAGSFELMGGLINIEVATNSESFNF